MHDLTEQMRAATDAPPPSRIDLDGFIVREQRRSRLLRWGGAATTAVALIAAMVAVPVWWGGGPGGVSPAVSGGSCPTPAANPTEEPQQDGPGKPGPSPLPADQCVGTVERLAAALRGELEAVAPELAATPHSATVFVYDARHAWYEAGLALAGPGGPGFVRIEVAAATEDAPGRNEQCPDTDRFIGPACLFEVAGDGTVLLGVDYGSTRKATAYRTDGTLVTAFSYVPNSDARQSPEWARPPLTVAQLLAVARAPGMALTAGATAAAPPARDPVMDRLSDRVADLLGAALPGSTVAPPRFHGSAVLGYQAQVPLGERGSVTVDVVPACVGQGCRQLPPCPAATGQSDCTPGPAGSMVASALSVTDVGQSVPIERVVRLHHRDGVVVTVHAHGPAATTLTTTTLTTLAAALNP